MTDDKKKDEIVSLADFEYDFSKAVITIGISLLPDDGHEDGRQVVINVKNHFDSPIVKSTRLNLIAFPEPIAGMLVQLKGEMPTRKFEHEKRLKEEEEQKNKRHKSSTAKAKEEEKKKAEAEAKEPKEVAGVGKVVQEGENKGQIGMGL